MTDTYVVDAKSGKATILKDPNAVLDYTFDWTEWLDDLTDTIASRVVTPGTGLTLDSDAIAGKKVIAWVSGGTAGTTYTLACRITTAGGRTDERTIYIKVKER